MLQCGICLCVALLLELKPKPLEEQGNAGLSINQDVFAHPPVEVFDFIEPRDLNTSAVEIEMRTAVIRRCLEMIWATHCTKEKTMLI